VTTQRTDAQVSVLEIGKDHPVVMGVLNVTPDSFSDGGRFADVDAAVAHGISLHRQGADIIDVGGESTRPGADRVDPATEVARVVPVISRLAEAGVPMSIDTTRADVAKAAIIAGASVINDVSGGLADPDMAGVAAEAGCPWILMHWRGHSRTMTELAVYRDVVAEVRDELSARVAAAQADGVAPSQIILDPGLGFAKNAEHNWELSAHLDEREAATLATSVLAVASGAWGVRVHEVRATVDALAVWRATGSPRVINNTSKIKLPKTES
jgi:dihydropteroate synthase